MRGTKRDGGTTFFSLVPTGSMFTVTLQFSGKAFIHVWNVAHSCNRDEDFPYRKRCAELGRCSCDSEVFQGVVPRWSVEQLGGSQRAYAYTKYGSGEFVPKKFEQNWPSFGIDKSWRGLTLFFSFKIGSKRGAVCVLPLATITGESRFSVSFPCSSTKKEH